MWSCGHVLQLISEGCQDTSTKNKTNFLWLHYGTHFFSHYHSHMKMKSVQVQWMSFMFHLFPDVHPGWGCQSNHGSIGEEVHQVLRRIKAESWCIHASISSCLKPLSPAQVYLPSLTTACPIWAMWTRIWCLEAGQASSLLERFQWKGDLYFIYVCNIIYIHTYIYTDIYLEITLFQAHIARPIAGSMEGSR